MNTTCKGLATQKHQAPAAPAGPPAPAPPAPPPAPPQNSQSTPSPSEVAAGCPVAGGIAGAPQTICPCPGKMLLQKALNLIKDHMMLFSLFFFPLLFRSCFLVFFVRGRSQGCGLCCGGALGAVRQTSWASAFWASRRRRCGMLWRSVEHGSTLWPSLQSSFSFGQRLAMLSCLVSTGHLPGEAPAPEPPRRPVERRPNVKLRRQHTRR